MTTLETELQAARSRVRELEEALTKLFHTDCDTEQMDVIEKVLPHGVGNGHPHIKNIWEHGGKPFAIFLRDGTKISIERDGTSAWMQVGRADMIYAQGVESPPSKFGAQSAENLENNTVEIWEDWVCPTCNTKNPARYLNCDNACCQE